jgi:hypothetical protein
MKMQRLSSFALAIDRYNPMRRSALSRKTRPFVARQPEALCACRRGSSGPGTDDLGQSRRQAVPTTIRDTCASEDRVAEIVHDERLLRDKTEGSWRPRVRSLTPPDSKCWSVPN